MDKISQEVAEAMVISTASGMAVSVVIQQGMLAGIIKGSLIYLVVIAVLFAYRIVALGSNEKDASVDRAVKEDENWRYT